MPRPEDVQPRNFTVERVLYDHNGFSVVVGIAEADGTRRVAMRWNGDEEMPAGYPSLGGNPLWFQLHEDLTAAVLAALIDREGTRSKELAEARQQVLSE